MRSVLNESGKFENENLWQVICQIFGAYFEDDCADELIHDPVLTAILGKEALASQPTLSHSTETAENCRKGSAFSARYITFKLCSSSPYKDEILRDT